MNVTLFEYDGNEKNALLKFFCVISDFFIILVSKVLWNMVNEEAAGLKDFFADFPKFLLYYIERSSLTYWREGTIRKCNSNGRLATTVTVASK